VGVPKLHATILLHLIISSGARYVIVQSKVKLGEEYHPTFCQFGSGNWIWLSIIARCAMADKSSSTVHMQKKRV
jgi:hypothetical protein